ncbi:4-hydroxyphenylpyruvate dioxygenase [Pseudoduganella lutea]|uniref:4-hydroxyphenylpyruvate dioxygenase n=1 Tax=Pseudoduganella lutea TaxID=321985 RepID=A0A4P6KSH2_9BURK|nr:4-hydroxyphenylpyruvate dioxygenase [Pseudoduganella lutea]QBE61627.1 4-hydroxyphenylpyruvate dioxygenase [Pseudoduganella lutea]
MSQPPLPVEPAAPPASPLHNNPLNIDGIEFIEYATTQPQALGALLEAMGFAAVARHRSREVTLYRQGGMNVIVNADPRTLAIAESEPQATVIGAIALRVRDADVAYRRAVDMGAWPIPTRAGVMELNIPGVHCAGDSILYFVDRVGDFSIYDVDFKPIDASAKPGATAQPPAVAGLHFFGVVQAIGAGRAPEWTDFYRQMLGFQPLAEGTWFGVVPKGTLLASPCHRFYLQLVEPPEGAGGLQWEEQLIRVGLGAPDVAAAVRALKERGIVFQDREPSQRGALTQLYRGGVSFELVASSLEQRTAGDTHD